MLFGEMGFEVERADRTAGGGVDLVAVDARPIRGGRIWVHGAWPAPGGAVDGDAVRALLDSARGEAAGKAVLVTLGSFTAEAREAARDTPVELVDGAELAALLKRHLPQAWATKAF
jgi:restriction system protein